MSGIGSTSRSAVSSAASTEPGFSSQLDTFRQVRRSLEESILPLATSVDGRTFSFQASLYGLELQVGSYVVLESDGSRRLGQVLTVELGRQPGTELTLPAQEAAPRRPGPRSRSGTRAAKASSWKATGLRSMTR